MAKVKHILGIAVIVALLIGSSALFLVSMTPVTAQGDEFESFSQELAEQLAEIYQQKQALTPVQRKIDWSILQVIREVNERLSVAYAGETPKFRDLSTPLLKIDDVGNIEVKLTVTSLTAEQLEQLEDLGMQIRLTLPEYGVIEGSLPHDRVEAVAGLDFVVNVGTPGYPLYRTGDVTSAGDAVLRAAEARAAFGVDGSGIKVGVMSNGVTHLSQSVATGDLPSSPAVDVLKAGYGDEGTATLEIIHDLAPGAPLAFYSPITSSDMVAGIGDLEAAGCKVIVDDIGFSNEPKFEDGPIAQQARQFCTNGGVYVTACGNDAQRHYMATYNRDGVVSVDNIIEYYAHDYGGGDIGNTFTIPNGAGIVIILQWNNQWGLSNDDFNLFLVRSDNGEVLACSINDQAGVYPDPWEGLWWINYTGSNVTVDILVLEWSLVNPPSSLVLDYSVWYGSGLEYVVPENSVIGHTAVEEVLSVAAADAATPNTIESFSSCGPGTVYFPTYEERQVPNITGVDGVQTKIGQLGYFVNPFYGTSASAPHVAAIAALVWEAEPTLTSSEVHNAITSTAVDLGPAGWDNTWGFGRVDAYEAVASVATPLPDLIVESLTHSPANPTTADTITFTAVVKNVGTAAAGASTLEFRVGGEFPYPTYPVPALTPGASHTVQRQEVLPAQSYLNTATADINDEVTESDETNNQKTDSYTVTQGPAVTVSINAPPEVGENSDFTADVVISQVYNFDAASYNVSVDDSVLRLDNVTNGQIDTTVIPVDIWNEISPGTYTIIQNVPGLAGVDGLGTLAVLHFHVVGTECQTSEINLSNGILGNNLAQQIPATWVGDSVHVSSAVLPGDANGDGIVNNLDITKVERIIVGLDAETPGADANQDGVVNNLDITKVERIIVGLD